MYLTCVTLMKFSWVFEFEYYCYSFITLGGKLSGKNTEWSSIHYRYNRIICRKIFSYVVWELKTNLFVEKRKQVLLADYFIAQVNADNFRHVCSRCLEFIHYKCLPIATRLKKLELSFKSQDLGAKIIPIL